MKNLSFLIVVTFMAFGVASCGNKDKDKDKDKVKDSEGSSSSPYTVSSNGIPKVETKEGFLDTVQPVAVVGNVSHQISQSSYGVMRLAFQQAQQQQPPIQPIMMNGSYKYRAKITGSVCPQQQQGIGNGYQQQPCVGNELTVIEAVIYR